MMCEKLGADLMVLGGTIDAGSDHVHVTLTHPQIIIGVKFLNAGTSETWWGIVGVGGEDSVSDAKNESHFVKGVITNAIPP